MTPQPTAIETVGVTPEGPAPPAAPVVTRAPPVRTRQTAPPSRTATPEVTVPDVQGMPPPDAFHALDRAGFDHVSVERVVVDDPHRVGQVLDQTPSPGTLADPAAPVVLTIGAAPPATTTP